MSISFRSPEKIKQETPKDGKTRSPGVLSESSMSRICNTVANRGILCWTRGICRDERGINTGMIIQGGRSIPADVVDNRHILLIIDAYRCYIVAK